MHRSRRRAGLSGRWAVPSTIPTRVKMCASYGAIPAFQDPSPVVSIPLSVRPRWPIAHGSPLVRIAVISYLSRISIQIPLQAFMRSRLKSRPQQAPSRNLASHRALGGLQTFPAHPRALPMKAPPAMILHPAARPHSISASIRPRQILRGRLRGSRTMHQVTNFIPIL